MDSSRTRSDSRSGDEIARISKRPRSLPYYPFESETGTSRAYSSIRLFLTFATGPRTDQRN